MTVASVARTMLSAKEDFRPLLRLILRLTTPDNAEKAWHRMDSFWDCGSAVGLNLKSAEETA